MTGVSGADATVFSVNQSVVKARGSYGKNMGESFAGIMSDSQSQMETSKETLPAKESENVKQVAEKFANGSRDKISQEKQDVEDNTKGLSEETNEHEMDHIQETAKELAENIAKTLGVSEEELLEAMENMGISLMELTNPVNLAKLTAEVVAETDVMTLITDENMFSSVEELSGQIAQTVEELAKELGVNVEELTTKLNEAVENLSFKEQLSFTTNEVQTEVTQSVNEVLSDVEVSENISETPKETQTYGNKEESKETVVLDKAMVNEHSTDKEIGGKQSDHNGANHQAGNSFQQTVVTEDLTTVTRTETPIFTSDIDVERILNQIGERVKIINKEEFSSMEMQLHPASLGNLQLQVKAKEGIITAQFTTENEAVKQVLEAQVIQLKERLEASGVKVEAVEVMVASHGFERNLEKGSSGEQNNYTAKKVARRKINLNIMDEEDLELENVEKQARDIQVDMMRRNGNTLDYMA